MGYRSKQRILNRRFLNGQKILKEMVNILSHQGNANQNGSEIPSYTCQMTKIKNTDENLFWRCCGARGNTPPLLLGVETCAVALEISMISSQKITCQFSSRPTLGHTSKGAQ